MAETAALTDDDRLRCSPWTRAQGVDPVGSAGTHDTIVLVESPRPWPDDVTGIPALAGAARDPRTRVFAVVPRDTDGHGRVRVVAWRRRTANRFDGTDHLVDVGGVAALVEAIVDDPGAVQPSAVGPAPPDVLICGHGRRDPCCGRWGTLLAAEVATRLTDVRVWRSSHTGGHRYAPTGLTLPDGHMWGFLDVDVVEAVVRRTGDVAAIRPHLRGSTAVDPWAQAVEAEVFGRIGWDWLEHDLTEATTAVDGDLASVILAWDGPTGPARADAVVEITRRLPVPICGEPLDHATKTSPELALRSCTVSAGPSVPDPPT